MPRRLVGLMVCVALTGLSCGPLFGSPAAIREATGGYALPPEPPVQPAALRDARAPHAKGDPSVAAVEEYLASRNTGLIREEVQVLARTLVEEARRHRLDLALVMAVMHVESRFYNFAISPAGAIGLMQILPSTGEELARREGIPWQGPQTLLDPATNVRLGTAYLRELSDRYRGDLRAALAAYNWGPGHVDRRLNEGVELPAEYPDLVTQARSQRAIARVSFVPTSSATKRSMPVIAASAEPR
jgi:soluble lytic murein transglycosylase-like protein